MAVWPITVEEIQTRLLKNSEDLQRALENKDYIEATRLGLLIVQTTYSMQDREDAKIARNHARDLEERNIGLEMAARHLDDHAKGWRHASTHEGTQIANQLEKKAGQIRDMKRK